jgi:hypothetical protein
MAGSKQPSGLTCCNCFSRVGDDVKVQPQNITPADGKGPTEIWCPRCFVWVRMRQEPERFTAHQSCVAKCQFEAAGCGWISVSFGARPGAGLRCFHCGRGGAARVEPRPEDIAEMGELLKHAQEEMRKAVKRGGVA